MDAANVRFNNRESRAEDLNLIGELKALIIQQQQMIAKLNEETRYFKLELLNREENFNKKFGGPEVNVGVMNTLSKQATKKGNTFVRMNANSQSNILSMGQIANAAANGISPAALQHSAAFGASALTGGNIATLRNVAPSISEVSTSRRKTLDKIDFLSRVTMDKTLSSELSNQAAITTAGIRGLMELRESRELDSATDGSATSRSLTYTDNSTFKQSR